MTAHFASSGPPSDGDLDFTVLERYWLGETSEEETTAMEVWFQTHPQWRERYRQLQHGITDDQWVNLSALDVDQRINVTLRMAGMTGSFGVPPQQIVENISSPIRKGAAGITAENVPGQHSGSLAVLKRVRTWGRVRIALTLGALSCLMLVVGWESGAYRTATTPKAHMFIYATPNGQQANLTLPDGSQVTLNAGSRLEVPSDFIVRTRQVTLSGEALFTVASRGSQPFSVIAGPSITRVLGTRFAIRHYPTDTTATIAVQDGKVAVSNAIGNLVLTANEQIQVGSRHHLRVRQTVPEQFSFAKGRLVMNNLSLREAIPDLNRWYDADVRLGSSILDSYRFTLESTGGSLTDLQTILEVTLSLRVQRTGRILTIFPK